MLLSEILPGWWYSDGKTRRVVTGRKEMGNGLILVAYLDAGRPPESFEHATRFARWAVFRARSEDRLRELIEEATAASGNNDVDVVNRDANDLPVNDERDDTLQASVIHGRLVHLRPRRNKRHGDDIGHTGPDE